MTSSSAVQSRDAARETPHDELVRLRALNRDLLERTRQLQAALDSRVAIEQAKGVLAERYGVEVGAAFELLRRAARANRLKLRELAAAVVAEPETPAAIACEAVRLRPRAGATPWR